MKITKLIIPLLGLSQIVNAKINPESLQLEKEKSVVAVEKEPDYYQQVIKFEPNIVQETVSQDENSKPEIQAWKRILYSPSAHEHWIDNPHCYSAWGTKPRTSFFITEFYFCDNPEPYWDSDKWAPEKNLYFHNNVLHIDWGANNIVSVEIYVIFKSWWMSETCVIDSYVINYANGVKEKISGKDLMTRKLLKN